MWRRKRVNVQVYPKWRARKLQFDLVNIIFYVNLYLFFPPDFFSARYNFSMRLFLFLAQLFVQNVTTIMYTFSERRFIKSSSYEKFCNWKVSTFFISSCGQYILINCCHNSLVCSLIILCHFFQRDFNIPRRAAKAVHRKSFIATTSPTLPRCHSPLSGMQLLLYCVITFNCV